MSFLHCHSCDWGQDDFWDFSFKKYSYNPIKSFFGYSLPRWIKPRWEDHHPTEAIGCGIIPSKWKPSYFIRVKQPEEWMNEEWYKKRREEHDKELKCQTGGTPCGIRLNVFSWYILLRMLKRRIKSVFVWQRWWTANGWWFSKLIGKDFSWDDKPVCPECGSKKLDID